ncbi:MAG: hypothetical protein Q8P76_01505 [bacterium]|nr:hypothetical protein [bacterium]
MINRIKECFKKLFGEDWNLFKIQRELETLYNNKDDVIITNSTQQRQDRKNILESRKSFIIQTIGIIIPLIIILPTIYFSYLQNNRANTEFELRNRPYLVIKSIHPSATDFMLRIKNVGILPAQVINDSIFCPKDSQALPEAGKIIIGNGEEMVFVFPIPQNFNSIECKFLIKYTIATKLFTQKFYSTEYIFRFKDDKTPLYESAFIN